MNKTQELKTNSLRGPVPPLLENGPGVFSFCLPGRGVLDYRGGFI